MRKIEITFYKFISDGDSEEIVTLYLAHVPAIGEHVNIITQEGDVFWGDVKEVHSAIIERRQDTEERYSIILILTK